MILILVVLVLNIIMWCLFSGILEVFIVDNIVVSEIVFVFWILLLNV